MGHNQSKHVCPTVDDSGPDIVPIVGNLTFHTISIIVAGVAAAFSCLIALILIMRHATHFSNPMEQKQIIRITTILPSFAIISLLTVAFNGSPAPYIEGAIDVGEAFPLAAFFLLMSAYIVPETSTHDQFFEALTLLDKSGNIQDGQGSLAWYRKLTFAVLQFIPISIIMWIATCISLAVGTYCATSNSPHFAHIWITVIRILSTVVCLISILRFYKRSKPLLKQHNTFQKLLVFKFLVFLNFIQTFVFNFLHTKNHLKGTDHLTVHDLATGIPALILACETAIAAPFFLWIYGVRPYVVKGGSGREYHGVVRALIEAVDLGDMVRELVRGVRARR